MSKRLAITISGAVSLGSFEAGVLYEVLTAIGRHNTDPATVANPADRIEIDVLTGASAGGMTAVIAALTLLYASDTVKTPEDNPFYNPWVRDISLDRLMKLDTVQDPAYPDVPAPEDSTKSIFSSNLIEKLARDYITHRYKTTPPAQPLRHPAVADEVRLGVALSNINGVAYSYPLRVVQPDDAASFAYARFQDEMTGRFSAGGTDGQDKLDAWKPWCEAAVACGAFPIAFRVHELSRLRTQYLSRSHLDPWPQPAQSFAYTDGGVFQNEPLGLAKKLVEAIDHPPDGADFLSAQSRFYLYVAPGAKGSGVNADFSTDTAQFLPAAVAIAKAAVNQAQFQDWINAEEVNDQIQVFNLRADQLFQTLAHPAAGPGGKIDPAVLQAAADALLPKLFATAKPPPVAIAYADWLGQSRARLRQDFDKESVALQNIGAAIEQAWIDSILVLETAAELSDKDEMYIYGITAETKDLAGNGLASFAGFFDLALRQHDYNLGRKNARAFLVRHRQPAPAPAAGSLVPPPDIGPIRYDPADAIADIPVPDRDPKTHEVLLSKLDKGVRERLRDTLSQRSDEIVDEILKHLDVNWLLAWPLRKVLAPIIKSQLEKRLAL